MKVRVAMGCHDNLKTLSQLLPHSYLLVVFQPIGYTESQQALEEAKAFIQEELRRKANQKEALAVMDEEQERLVEQPHSIPNMQMVVVVAEGG